MKINYIMRDGEKLDIRSHVGPKLRYFTVTQGACSDGKYIYMVFERKRSNDHSHRCKIVKIEAETMKVVRVSQPLKTGHGNDICYRDGILYITHSSGSRIIHRVDAGTLIQKKGIHVTVPEKFKGKGIKAFNGIACYGSGYVLRVMGGPGMVIVNKDFKVTRYFRTEKNYTASQGIDQKGGVIYRSYSKLQSDDKNYLALFDKKGKLLKRSKLDVTGELESVFLVGDQVWFSIYRKKKVDGKWVFRAHLGKEKK